MKLAFIVLAHRSPEQVVLLLSALDHPDANVYLHVDRRTPMPPFRRALAAAGLDGVVALPRHTGGWGSTALVDAALDGIAAGLTDGCDYFVLLSGQDFPARPIDEFAAFLEATPSRSYVRAWPSFQSIHRFGGRDRTDFYTYTVLGRRELCIPRGEDTSFLSWKGRSLNAALRMRSALKPARRFPPYVRPFTGQMWWNISRDAAEHIVSFVHEHPDYRRYHAHTWCADELFFQSILLGTDFHERHEVADVDLRFYVWEDTRSRILTAEDLPAIIASGKPFARKFDITTDRVVLERLAERVGLSPARAEG